MTMFEIEWLRIGNNIFNLEQIIHIHLVEDKIDVVHIHGVASMVFDNAESAKETFEEIYTYVKNQGS